jgi:DNA-binding transcriptional regulator YiaG
MTWVETIRQFRRDHPGPKGRDMAQETLSRYLGVSSQSISNWELGYSESVGAFRTMILVKLAAYTPEAREI